MGEPLDNITISATVEVDGELHLRNLPCKKGDRVEAVLRVPLHPSDDRRAAARERLLERARTSQFSSNGKRLNRDELHERA